MEVVFNENTESEPRATRVDLYLDGEFGQWVLDRVGRDQVGHVFTTDPALAAHADQLNLPVSTTAPGNLIATELSALSVHYHRVFPADFLARYERIYNLHPGYLPWGRGYYPVFWALWEETPAGATLHHISAGLDEGPIVAQVNVSYSSSDTGGTLHQRVRTAEEELFLAYWPRIAAGERLPALEQPAGGSYHSKADFFKLKRTAPWASMRSVDLVRLIRALSFSGYSGLEIELDGRTYEMHMTPLPGELHEHRHSATS